MKEESLTMMASEKEMRLGKLIRIVNIIIGIIFFFPALACFFITDFEIYSSEANGTDIFFGGSSGSKTILWLSFVSMLIVLFYRTIIINPFNYEYQKQNKRKYLSFWLQVLIINSSTLFLFIFTFGKDFIPAFLPIENGFQFLVFLILYLPFIPLFILIVGLYFNTKRNQNNISNEN